MEKITASSNIGEILERWPDISIIFLKYRMSCPGCYLVGFEHLNNALEVYNIPEEQFLESLQEIIKEGQ